MFQSNNNIHEIYILIAHFMKCTFAIFFLKKRNNNFEKINELQTLRSKGGLLYIRIISRKTSFSQTYHAQFSFQSFFP